MIVTAKGKTVACLMLAVTALALLIYGAAFHSVNIYPENATDLRADERSELFLTREVTIGGVARDTFGDLRQTYTGKPPQACPT